MSSSPAARPSIARTGLKVGATFLLSMVKSVVLAVGLPLGVLGFYAYRLDAAGLFTPRRDGIGSFIAFLGSAPIVVAVLLLCFIPVYVTLGVARARSRVVEKVAVLHGDLIAERLAGVIAARIEAMPRAHQTLHLAADWLTADALSRQLAPALGDSAPVRMLIEKALEKLPLPDVFAQWQQMRAEAAQPDMLSLPAGEPAMAAVPTLAGACDGPAPDPVLRALLAQHIGAALLDLTESSRRMFHYAFAAHAALLGVGIWLTRAQVAAPVTGTPMW
jgi:hypothetical protein